MTATWKLPVVVNVQDSVVLPEPATLALERVQEVLLVARLTTPLNPLSAVMLMVEFPGALTLRVRLVGLAMMVKSWILNVRVVLWDRLPFVPVTATCLVPDVVNVHVSVEVPEPVRLFGETVHEVLFVARVTIPMKPLSGESVMVDIPEALAFALTVDGLAVSVKS